MFSPEGVLRSDCATLDVNEAYNARVKLRPIESDETEGPELDTPPQLRLKERMLLMAGGVVLAVKAPLCELCTGGFFFVPH